MIGDCYSILLTPIIKIKKKQQICIASISHYIHIKYYSQNYYMTINKINWWVCVCGGGRGIYSGNSFWKLGWIVGEIIIVYEVKISSKKYNQIKNILILNLIYESAKKNIKVLLFFL